jgi:hypothetical protein
MFSRQFTAAAALALLCTALSAHAQTPTSAQLSEAAAMEAMTPAQKAKLAPRRQTEQVVGTPLPTVTDGYRPTLTSPPSGAQPPVGALPVHPTPAGAGVPDAPLPVPVNDCVAGSCAGADGKRYNAGPAGTAVDPAGRICRKVGNTVQCS